MTIGDFIASLSESVDETDVTGKAINGEIDRTINALPTMDVGTEEYHRATESLSTLTEIANTLMQMKFRTLREIVSFENDYMDLENKMTCGRTDTEDKAEEPAHVDEPDVFVEDNPVIVEKKYGADDAPKIRTALALKKKSGVDIVEVMKKFGATNFKDVNPDDYDALMAELGE